jgi:predicted GNAT superfamily acetyltransferase
MHTTASFGGITLGAFAGERLVGYSYALPGFDGRPFLLSCGLAVAPGFESRGVGHSLKLAQASHARRAGYEVARWTTNALASRPLHLYLSKLGARLVRYRAGMYAGLGEPVLPDEVEIEWDLGTDGPAGGRPRADRPRPLTRTRAAPGGARHLVGVEHALLREPRLPGYSVEIPWERATLARDAPELAGEWLAGVRLVMRTLLAAGYVGTAVLPDARSRRSFVVFDKAGTEPS